MMLHDQFQSLLTTQRPIRLNANGIERIHHRTTERFIIIHHKHFPCRENHVHFFDSRSLKIYHHMELRAFAQLTFHLNTAFHGVNNIFRDGHTQTGAFRLVHSPVVRSGIRLKNLGHKLRRHTNPVIFD